MTRSSDGWHTFKRRSAAVDCRPGFRPPPPSKLRLRIDVLREQPPVYVVHDFATASECEHMMNITVPHMAPSVVFGGGSAGQASSYRQSFSVNMYPDWDDESDVVTRMVRRKFAFAREVAEYDQLIEGEGQEPLNSVYYKNYDDQYRPHCDGQCHGGAYRKGERSARARRPCALRSPCCSGAPYALFRPRVVGPSLPLPRPPLAVATSLTYCSVGKKGGYATRLGQMCSASMTA